MTIEDILTCVIGITLSLTILLVADYIMDKIFEFIECILSLFKRGD